MRLTRMLPLGILAFLMALGAGGTARAATTHGPVRHASVPGCQFGAYVTGIYNVQPALSMFSSRFWVWSLCPEKAWDPLPGLSFPDATQLSISNNQYSHELGHYRHVELLQGIFHQGMDEAGYPFDRQALAIEITPAQNVTKLQLTADGPDSIIAPNIEIPGWKVTGYHVDVGPKRFVGNLGNQSIPATLGHVKSTVLVNTTLARSDPVGFLQIAAPLWIIFLVAVVSFMRIDSDPDRIGSRVPLLAGLVLAIILNMTMANSVVFSDTLSMVDELHILTLAVVLGALVVNTYHWRWSLVEGEDAAAAELRIERHRKINLAVGISFYVAVTTLLLLHASA